MKKQIDVFDYAGAIMKALSRGVLLTTKANGRVNTMAISWGTLGIEWSKPIFTTVVRTGRFTREMLDANGEFTVNIPVEDSDRSLIGKCGSVSGRNVDKIAVNKLTLIDGDKVSVPAIKEFPLTLECRVVQKQLQDKTALDEELRTKFYPEDVASDKPGNNADPHIAYVGEIVAAYVME